MSFGQGSTVAQIHLRLLLLLLAIVRSVHTLPTGRQGFNETGVQELQTSVGMIRYNPEPVGRGTFGIIFSCTATYIFCVWTAVHPNINVKVKSSTRLWYKCTLMVMSVIIPEGLFILAVGQYREAKMLREKWKSAMKGKSKEAQNKLGMSEAFFVVMGGFLTDAPKSTGNDNLSTEMINEERQGEKEPPMPFTAILTASGFCHYLKQGYIDENSFDVGDIRDKGKANNIAKLLACGQAVWLIVQSCGRLGSGLPLTLLEVHVLIQVFCTSFIYGLWWFKPLDVEEPVLIVLNRKATPTDEDKAPPDFSQEGVLQAQLGDSQNYSRDMHLITKRPCSDSLAVMFKAFFDLGAYIYSGETVEKTKMALDGVLGMVLEWSLVLMVGGLHLLAWDVHFPTLTESLLWKISAFGMIVFPAIVVIAASSARYESDLFPILWKAHFGGVEYRGLLSFGLGHIKRICTTHALKKKSPKRQPSDTGSVLTDETSPAETGSLITNDPSSGETGSPTKPGGTGFAHSLRIFGHYCLVSTALLSLLGYALCTSYIVTESYLSMRDPPSGTFITTRWSDFWPHL